MYHGAWRAYTVAAEKEKITCMARQREWMARSSSGPATAGRGKELWHETDAQPGPPYFVAGAVLHKPMCCPVDSSRIASRLKYLRDNRCIWLSLATFNISLGFAVELYRGSRTGSPVQRLVFIVARIPAFEIVTRKYRWRLLRNFVTRANGSSLRT